MNNHAQLFDVWSLAALTFWALMGTLFWRARDRVVRATVISVSVLATFLWEVVDYFLAHKWGRWPAESWVNAWLSDPLMAIVGVTLAWWALKVFTRQRAPAT